MPRLPAIFLLLACGWTAFAAPNINEAKEKKKLDALLADIGSKCLAAENSTDLNTLWSALTELSKNLNHFPTLPSRVGDLHGAINFVTLWRDYLSAREVQDFGKAHDILARLLESRSWLSLTPRSPVLERLEEKNGYVWRWYSTSTPENIPKVIAALEDIQRVTRNPEAYEKTLKTLYSLQEIWNNRDKGNWSLMEQRCRLDEHNDNVDVRQFKLQILAYALPGYLDLDSKNVPTIKDGESAVSYLNRIEAQAIANGDMITLWRVSTYRNHLAPSRTPWVLDEIAARELCVDG